MTPIWLLAAAVGLSSPSPADTTLPALHAEIAGLVAGFRGDVGAAAIHLETGRGVAVGGETPFFLASVYKLPIAIALLRTVDAGAVSLGDTVRLAPWDFRIGRATLAPNRPGGSGAYTVARLLEAMIFDSDNSSSDAILRLAGGPGGVSGALHAMGIPEIRVDRSEVETLLEFYGIPDSLPEAERMPGRLTARVRASPAAARRAAVARFAAAPEDAGTALALAELLDRLWKGELLSPASTRLLLTHMRNGAIDTRILAGVPPGTPVWHKTGSYAAAATHDAGIVALPDGTHLAIVVLVRQPARDTEAAERLIADVTRAAWEFWTGEPERSAEGALSRAAPRGSAEDRR